MAATTVDIFIYLLIAINLHQAASWPQPNSSEIILDTSGQILDQAAPITLDKIKLRLKESEIFDWTDPSLSEREKKEMGKLFDTVEIMATSRSRQPANVQSMFASLRLVERVVKKQLKENQISESLADKFNWKKLDEIRAKREPTYTIDEATNMRKFMLN